MEQREDARAVRARCVVCGRDSGTELCDRCRESLALCDVEDFVEKKTGRKICVPARANAFK